MTNLWRRAPLALGWVGFAIGISGLAVGRFGGRCDACDLANIAYPLWIVIALPCAGLLAGFALSRRGGWWTIAALMGMLVVAGDREWLSISPKCLSNDGPNRLRIVSFNASMDNPEPSFAAAWIRREAADIVVLVEAKGGSAQIPRMLARDFPYQLSCSAQLPCSTMILSRIPATANLPFGRGDVENRQGLSAAAMKVDITGYGPVTIVAAHLSRPLPIGRQRRELEMLLSSLAGIASDTMIVAGDFNITADSTTFGAFVQALRLAYVPVGPTWPTKIGSLPVPGFIAIDHIFVGRRFRVRAARLGPDIGSDHRPISAALCL